MAGPKMRRALVATVGATTLALGLAGARPSAAEIPSVCVGVWAKALGVGPLTTQVTTNQPCPPLPATDPEQPCPGWIVNQGVPVDQPPVEAHVQVCATGV